MKLAILSLFIFCSTLIKAETTTVYFHEIVKNKTYLVKKAPTKKSVFNKKTMTFSIFNVKDFKVWKKIHNQESDTTNEFSYLLNVDTTNIKVGVYQFTNGHNNFRKEISSKQYNSFIHKAGIKSKPSYSYLNIMWINPEQQKKQYYIIISHKVIDFVKWKVDFDLNRENRGYIGISDVFVATYENDINYVTMALAVDNFETCKALFSNPDVVGVLKKAGVIGKLDITYWKVMSN